MTSDLADASQSVHQACVFKLSSSTMPNKCKALSAEVIEDSDIESAQDVVDVAQQPLDGNIRDLLGDEDDFTDSDTLSVDSSTEQTCQQTEEEERGRKRSKDRAGTSAHS